MEEFEDGISIHPPKEPSGGFTFDPEGDHRLAMAAGVLLKAGIEFKLLHPEVVNKSFPEFWSCVGLEA